MWDSVHDCVRTKERSDSSKNPTRSAFLPGSPSVRSLKLDFGFKEVNLIPLRALAPNILSFELVFCPFKAQRIVFPQLRQLWTQLEVVRVKGKVGNLERNYDGDFCGIHEEEAGWL